MPTFSIIVPVYNAEKTLHKCLDSLCVQTIADFEVLMVENGSGDTSRAICRKYAQRDPRFILHASDGSYGPSGARNIGLEHAKGEFVAFVDSDDYVEPEYLEVLYRSFANADVVFFGYHQIATDGRFLGEHIPQIKEVSDYYETLVHLHRQDMFGYTWIKAFRRDTIGQHRFSVELNLLEDEVFTCEILTKQRRIAVIPKALYNYVTGNTGSLVGRTHQDYCRKVDTAYQAWKNLLNGYDKKETVLASMANSHVSRCMYYGFERDVDVNNFFDDLAKTEFFANTTVESEFTVCAKERNFKKLSRMRTSYQLKNKLAKLLKR